MSAAPPTTKDIARWRRRARAVFNAKDYDRQCDLALELARDVLRVLDPTEYRRPR